MRRVGSTALAALVGLLFVSACGDRPEAYDAPITRVAALGMEDRVALLDAGAHRVLFLAPRAGQELDRASVVVGKNVVRADVAPDGKRLFVLSAGDVPKRKADDEGPSLTVIGPGSDVRRFPLESPRSGIALDPLGRYAVLFEAAQSTQAAPSTTTTERSAVFAPVGQAGFVGNPNQIEIVDFQAPPEAAVVARTIRSFGASPQRVAFTPQLGLPGGPRRLLVVQTQQDVTLLDLDNARAGRPEITVRPTTGATTAVLTPEAVAVDDGDPGRSDDARIAIRFTQSPSVLVLTLVPTPADAKPEGTAPLNDFTTSPNLTDVGGPATDVAFVRTEAGLRLAAVVGSRQSAVLVDPATSTTTTVAMPGAFTRLALVTGALGGDASTDTALLYGAGTRGVAFWSLGRTLGQPYRSVEAVTVPATIDEVLDVPPPRQTLKVLRGSAGENAFFVLDLATRTVAPLSTTSTAALHVAGDGQRVWAFQRSSTDLAQVDLADLSPRSFRLERRIEGVFDVKSDGGRALVAVDTRGAGAVTLLDAVTPDTATSRSYYGLLLEDLR